MPKKKRYSTICYIKKIIDIVIELCYNLVRKVVFVLKALNNLPENYTEYFSVNLLKNKKQATVMYIVSIAVALVMFFAAHFAIPFSTLIDEENLFKNAIKFGVLAVGSIAYIILHEAVHGIAMKICGTKKIKYGFVGTAAYAGSDDYYDKKAYIFIALAPVVLWGIVLAIINFVVPREWFWVVYIIQITNMSGAAGDLYVTFKFLGFPKDILVRDSGTAMKVYSASGAEMPKK